MKYSDQIADWLVQLGYTHCFYVGGGNIMHLVESCSRRMKCVPTVHEVAAGIAAEYFNETSDEDRAFALVTAGPGLTNIVTSIAGAWLESRELLVIGGQVKTDDLARGRLRQRGIQEIDGASIVRSITKKSVLMDSVLNKIEFFDIVRESHIARKGPVFLEIPLDIQARDVDEASLDRETDNKSSLALISETDLKRLAGLIHSSDRPMLLIGGGVDRSVVSNLKNRLISLGIPLTTTWNGADRIPSDHPYYFGRPNTWGQRYSNIILQQADLLVTFGTRLSLQQTGFNWQQFVPSGDIVQIDCDLAELSKGHPEVSWPICADANDLLTRLLEFDLGSHDDWLDYCNTVRSNLPLIEENTTGIGYVSPYEFVVALSALCSNEDTIIPCSSGGAFTVMMQGFAQKEGQKIVTNKGLASMGYGLSGAIGASFARTGRTILVEGDGGFAQNIQEIGTAAINNLNIKIFILDDNGYASIRSTQINYFGGRYVGCDINTGLGLPNLAKLFSAYNVPVYEISEGFENSGIFRNLFNSEGVAAFIVPVDPNQTYFPRITSKMVESGGMVSNPLHKMSPDLDIISINRLARYID